MNAPDPIGRVEQATIDEAFTYRASRPALYESAITLARVLDNPEAVTQHSVAATRLSGILTELRAGKIKQDTPLASVKAMTKKTG